MIMSINDRNVLFTKVLNRDKLSNVLMQIVRETFSTVINKFLNILHHFPLDLHSNASPQPDFLKVCKADKCEFKKPKAAESHENLQIYPHIINYIILFYTPAWMNIWKNYNSQRNCVLLLSNQSFHTFVTFVWFIILKLSIHVGNTF